MKRRFAALILMLTVACSGQAQSAEDLIGRIQDRYSAAPALSAQFTQTTSGDVFDGSQTVDGTIWLKGDAYRVEIGADVFASDGDTTWAYRNAQEQVLVDFVYEDPSTLSVGQLLYGVEDRFRAVGHRRSDGATGRVWLLDLEPLDDGDFFRSVTLSMRDSDGMVTRIEVLDANEVTIDIRLSDIVEFDDLPADTFRFDAPDGTEVIDLRS